jgi:hypothetical protein
MQASVCNLVEARAGKLVEGRGSLPSTKQAGRPKADSLLREAAGNLFYKRGGRQLANQNVAGGGSLPFKMRREEAACHSKWGGRRQLAIQNEAGGGSLLFKMRREEEAACHSKEAGGGSLPSERQEATFHPNTREAACHLWEAGGRHLREARGSFPWRDGGIGSLPPRGSGGSLLS